MKVALLEGITDATPFLSDDAYCAQEKVDGERCLIEKRGGVVAFYNRKGAQVAAIVSLVEIALSVPHDFLIDGERIGEKFVAFDIQGLDGVDISAKAFSERLATLRAICPFDITRCSFGAEKTTLLETVRTEGGEGVVFKKLSEPYRDGRECGGGQYKFKFWRSESFVVTSLDIARSSVAITRAGVDHGRVSFSGRWPKPGDIVEVRFAKVHASGKLCRPVFLGVRSDLDGSDITAPLCR